MINAIILVLLIMFSGCACTHDIYVDSIPQGATVLIDGEVKGITPSMITITHASGIDAVNMVFKKDGYSPTPYLLFESKDGTGEYVYPNNMKIRLIK